MKKHTLSLLFSLIALTVLAGTARAQTDAVQRLRTYRYGGDRAVLDAVAQWVSASRPDPARRHQAARELAAVAASDAAFEARQFACRQLVLIASEEQIPALAGLLGDEQLAHYALLALARIPGEAVNTALRKALSDSRGRARLEIMDTLGERRDPHAVPALAGLARAADPAVSEAAVAALGKMSDPRAVQAVRQAFAQATGDRRATFGHILLDCAERMRTGGDKWGALALYSLLNRPPATPVLRAAALRGIVLTRGEKALPLVIRALGEDAGPRQKMAAVLAREAVGARATAQLCAALEKLPPRGQVLLLDALADRADRAATPAIATFCRASSGEPRLVALRALGGLGDASTVPMLLEAAASGTKEDAEAARSSLARLRGNGVEAKLLEALDQAQPPLRVQAITCLGQRGARAAMPRLLQEARSPQREVSAAALQVLRALGQPEQLPAVLDLLLATTPGERDAVMAAAADIARRGADESQRSEAILTRLNGATRPADQADLLALLGEIGGSRALAALRKAALDTALEPQVAALKVLAEWPTDEPMADLLAVVRATQDATARAIALRGYLRLIGVNDQRAPEQALALYREAAGLTRSPEEKRLVLSGLTRIRSLAALEYAAGYLADSAVRPEAELAVVEIGRCTLGAWPDRTRTALEPIARDSADEAMRARAREALAVAGKFGDFITAWEVSPAYQQEGADYSKLFDIAFPPEQPEREKEVPWRLMPAGTSAEQPWLLDLLALWGGEQRVAYLRTAVWTETARDLTLELGSDDGPKVWWNGQLVLSNNTARAVAPGQEKVKVAAKAGWNVMLLKVTQNVMGWGACARITGADGSPAAGLRFAVPSAMDAAKP